MSIKIRFLLCLVSLIAYIQGIYLKKFFYKIYTFNFFRFFNCGDRGGCFSPLASLSTRLRLRRAHTIERFIDSLKTHSIQHWPRVLVMIPVIYVRPRIVWQYRPLFGERKDFPSFWKVFLVRRQYLHGIRKLNFAHIIIIELFDTKSFLLLWLFDQTV